MERLFSLLVPSHSHVRFFLKNPNEFNPFKKKKKNAASAKKDGIHHIITGRWWSREVFFLEQASFIQLHDILLSAGSFWRPSLRAQLQPPVTAGQIHLHHTAGQSLLCPVLRSGRTLQSQRGKSVLNRARNSLYLAFKKAMSVYSQQVGSYVTQLA